MTSQQKAATWVRFPTSIPSPALLGIALSLMLWSPNCFELTLAQVPNNSGTTSKKATELPLRVSVSQLQIKKSGIRTEKPVKEPFTFKISLTGRVSLNEDRLAHIFPIVSGQVESVDVRLGDVVKEGDLLVTVHSREVGTAKLDLFQAKLALELASLKLKLQEELAGNTKELLGALQKREEITEIQSRFSGRTMGDYREKLLQSYSGYIKSEADVQRLSSIANSGAISSKQLVWAQASRNADLATFLSRIEQVEYELKTSLLQASQLVKEADTRVAVSATNLRIMGCRNEDIADIDPKQQGEAVSDYSIRAPFQGTVISKDVVLREQIRPETQIMSIADLSTVWIEANIYEKDVPLLESLKTRSIRVRNAVWPDREFEATIFYTGEIMDEKTRTISMRAIAKNTGKVLKPGMFVNIDFQAGHSNAPVIQIPSDAIIEHEGKQFVFVNSDDGQFERRDVQVGAKNETMIVIENGLHEADSVVVAGGFLLKSKMLEGLLGE